MAPDAGPGAVMIIPASDDDLSVIKSWAEAPHPERGWWPANLLQALSTCTFVSPEEGALRERAVEHILWAPQCEDATDFCKEAIEIANHPGWPGPPTKEQRLTAELEKLGVNSDSIRGIVNRVLGD